MSHKKLILDFDDTLINLENVFSIHLTGSRILIHGNCDRMHIDESDNPNKARAKYENLKELLREIKC